jgi:Polyketide cyclase / dehydrase and lipid transport
MAGTDRFGQLAQREIAKAIDPDVAHRVLEQPLTTHPVDCTMWYMNQVVQTHETTAAPPERVFALLADTENWPKWSGHDRAELVRPGSPDRQGVGARRAFEPPHHLGYVLVSGLPVKDYRADVTVAALDGGGTAIDWRSTFRPSWPGSGFLIRRALQIFITRAARSLARAAEAGETA